VIIDVAVAAEQTAEELSVDLQPTLCRRWMFETAPPTPHAKPAKLTTPRNRIDH